MPGTVSDVSATFVASTMRRRPLVWNTLFCSSALSRGYDGTLFQGSGQSTSSNPLAGRQAYAGTSPGYPAFITETISLGTTWANQAIKVRFRVGSDDAEGAPGWDLDDIQFSGITNTPFNAVIEDASTCGVATTSRPGPTSVSASARSTSPATGAR